MRQVLVALIFCCLSLHLIAQHNFGIKYFGFSIHPNGDAQANLMPYKLDKQARFIVNFGTILSYQRFIYRDLVSYKFAQGIYTDSGGLLSGHTHLGMRIMFLELGKHNFSLGFGPTLIYRRHWNIKPGYESTGLFRETGNLQYKAILYGGEIEYNCELNEHFDFSMNFLPGYPIVMSFGAGIRYWPNGRY